MTSLTTDKSKNHKGDLGRLQLCQTRGDLKLIGLVGNSLKECCSQLIFVSSILFTHNRLCVNTETNKVGRYLVRQHLSKPQKRILTPLIHYLGQHLTEKNKGEIEKGLLLFSFSGIAAWQNVYAEAQSLSTPNALKAVWGAPTTTIPSILRGAGTESRGCAKEVPEASGPSPAAPP